MEIIRGNPMQIRFQETGHPACCSYSSNLSTDMIYMRFYGANKPGCELRRVYGYIPEPFDCFLGADTFFI